MINYSIALGFKGKLYNNINKALKIFKQDMNIKYMLNLLELDSLLMKIQIYI